MTYIYDITLNLTDEYYDFFEWNKSDSITHIRKIPIYSINKQDFINLYNYEIKLNDFLLNKLKDKTEIYGKKNKNITCCLFKYNDNILALEFNNNGISNRISALQIEEELDVIDIKTSILPKFEYNKTKQRKIYITTRLERKNKKLLQKQLSLLNIPNDDDKIKYIYFEYFGEIIDNTDEALAKLKSMVKKQTINDNLKYFLKLVNNHN